MVKIMYTKTKKMIQNEKNKIAIAITLSTLAIFGAVNAEYIVKFPLDPKSINIGDIPITGSININPSQVNRGQTAVLSWNFSVADKVIIEGLGNNFKKNGSITITPDRNTTYRFRVESGTDTRNYTAEVVVSQPTPTVTLTAENTRIGLGMPVNLTWSTLNAERAYFSHNPNTDVSLSGSSSLYPTSDITYTLYAIGYDGFENANKSVSIDVVDNAVINSFTATPEKLTVGDQATFAWNVTDAESLELKPYGIVQTNTTNISIPFNTVGNFNYSLEATSLNGTKVNSSSKVIEVFGVPTISSLSVNGSETTIYASPEEDLTFNWITTNTESLTFNGSPITGNSTSLQASNSNGTTNYSLIATNGAGRSVNKSISVNTIADAEISTINAPSNVFVNSPFLISWSGTGSSYSLESNSNGSGISAAHASLGSSLNTTVTPSGDGTMVYTLVAKNLANKETRNNKSVVVEGNPTLTSLLVNGQNSVTVSPNEDLIFTETGISDGASLQSVFSDDSETSFVTKSPVTAGTYTYYAVAKKTLNSVTRKSIKRSVNVTVIEAPTVDLTAPSIVFNNSTFSLNWTSSNQNELKISSNNNNSGVAVSGVIVTGNSYSVQPTSAGTYVYTIKNTNAAGVEVNDSVTVVVEPDPTFTTYTVNGSTSISVSPSDALAYSITGQSSGATLVGRNAANNANATNPTTAPATAGSYTYYGAVSKTINSVTRYSTVRSVNVNVVDAPSFGTVTAPTNVFANASFTLSWTANNSVNYKIKSNNVNSGIGLSDVDLGTNLSTNITPTSAGTFIYTITATNAAGVTTTSTKTVIVESNPTFTGFTVNGSTSATVAPSATLTFAVTGLSTGSALQGRNSANTADATLPTAASATAGSTTYYAVVSKTLNGVERLSSLRNVTVTVVNNPSITSVTAPTNVFSNAAFTMSWVATNATNYKIRADLAGAGVSTSNVDLGTVTSYAITPTAAGTYVYTLTATNDAGVTTTSTKSVIVEADPTISAPRINSAASPNVLSGAALTATATMSSGATLSHNVPANAPTNVGPYTYTYTSTKTLNGVTRTSSSTTITLDVGYVYSMVVGRYGDSGEGYGYLSPGTGWTIQQAGSMSNYKYAGTDFLAVYTVTNNTGQFYINFVGTNGLFDNRQIRINGVLCSQTVAYYDYLGGIDTYQYHTCASGLTSKLGQTVKLYIN